jgi:NADH-quinone oxidoreductase subunit J
MNFSLTLVDAVLGGLLVLSSLGTILLRQPVHACLSFLLTLLLLSSIYVTLSAEFIGVMQILVYAGAILVLFMFVIVLFQDAHQALHQFMPRSSRLLAIASASLFILAFLFFEWQIKDVQATDSLSAGYGTVEALGKDLYDTFFFPFEAMLPLFLVAIVGSVYIARRRE